MSHRLIAIIPARGGSRRLPGKNLRPLAGVPLLAHTVRQARAAERIETVYVSTDDDAVASVAEDHGASVVRRPPDLATDTASSESALLHALDAIEAQGAAVPEAVVMPQCTSPLRAEGDIDNAIRTFEDDGADSLFSACPNQRFLWRRGAGGAVPVNYDYRNRPRSQDFGQFQENGSIYVTRTALLRETGNRLGGRISIYEMAPWSAFEIDDENDFALVEWILEHRGPGPGS